MVVKGKKIPLFLTASILFSLKTYIVYRFMLNIELENMLQEFILLINPFVSSIIFFSIAIWFKKSSRQINFIRYAALIGTLVIYFNLVFYRSFTDFLTIPQLFQTSNTADLGTSVLSLIKFYDVFFFVDVVIIWYLSKNKELNLTTNYTKRRKTFAFAVSLMLLSGNFFLAEMERPQLFTRAFDREYLVKNIGLFYYHIYDAAVQSKVKSQRVLADGNKLPEIKSYINEEIRSNKQSKLMGTYEGRNVIFISAESIQSFVIQNTLYGDEITPFMNQLVNDKDTYYFENFYHQTQQGKTSDSEFVTENSLYPSSRGAVFFTHGENEYHAMPEMLEEKGYYSAVFHANNKSFWNRDQIYNNLAIDDFYDRDAYEITDENSVGWGLKDKPFFEQSMKYLQSIEEPFYAKFITLTNHFPFELGEEDRSVEKYDSNSNTLNNYFPTVRYTDEAIEQFFHMLKQTPIYENSIIVIMGDHDGISANHNKAMSEYLNKEEITPYDYVQLQRVPLFIHIPGSNEGKVMSKLAGQIDLKPTILHMLGIDTTNDIYFGNDLFHNDRKEFIAFRNGDFVSENYLSASGICYDRSNGEEVGTESETAEETPCTPFLKKVETELEYSDEIIYGDLFRFVDFNSNDTGS
ncbi:LTA synthase family protein [Virgibacillus sp. W0181]|uniref:LTA synthase family protein n=1 Tax=Virgibacillus sp. W0181 TaxID=3391581 RepID=UPI003F44B54E